MSELDGVVVEARQELKEKIGALQELRGAKESAEQRLVQTSECDVGRSGLEERTVRAIDWSGDQSCKDERETFHN